MIFVRPVIKMISNFINNYNKNKIYVILILLIGFVASITFYSSVNVHYKGTAVLQMSYVESKRLFVEDKILIYPLKGHNIFLIERLFRDIQKNRIKINKECFKGSVFDDSNEFSARRKQLGFSPGFDFKISRTDFEVTIEYRDTKISLVEECVNSFIEGFTDYQNQIYDKHIISQKKLYENVQDNNQIFFDFATAYAKKYNLKQYYEEWMSNKFSKETKNKIENSGANFEIAELYFKLIEKHFNNPSLTTSFYERFSSKIISPVKVVSLGNQKILIFLIINFISFIGTFIFVLIKEYDH